MNQLLVRLAPIVAVFGAASLLVTWGCASEAQLSNPIECVIQAECDEGMVCENQICVVSTTPDEATIDLEIQPARGSNYARLQQLNLPIADLLQKDRFELPEATVYETAVQREGGEALGARLAIFSQEGIPGRELVYAGTLLANMSGPALIALSPGGYAVRITPNLGDIPAVEIRDFTVRDTGEILNKQFELPATYRRLSGEVTSLVQQETKLAGYTVRATAVTSGLVSTATVTSEDGRFAILLPESNETRFLVEAIPPGDLQAQWGYARTFTVRDDREVRLGVEPVDPAARGAAELQIVGFDLSGRTLPLANAQVTLTATVTSVPLPPVHSIKGRTNQNGIVEVDVMGQTTAEIPLLQSNYRIDVQPPSGSEMSPYSEIMSFTEVLPTYTFSAQVAVPRRARVSGLVHHLDTDVAGASVDLVPLDGGELITATTNTQGSFEMSAGGGRYLLVVRPAPTRDDTTALAAAITEIEVPVGADFFQVDSIELPVGRIWRGRVVGLIGGAGATEALVNTVVEAFVRVNGRAVSVARATTDSTGTVQLVLP